MGQNHSLEDRLQELYDQMRAHAKVGDFWKNIPLARETLRLMKEEASEDDRDDIQQLCEWVVTQKLLLDYETPRLILSFMELWTDLSRDDQRWAKEIQHLRRMIDPNTPEEEKLELMTEGRFIKYDPIQLSEAWEENIYEVEKELDEEFKDTDRFMGFCYSYWSSKRAALARRGIVWRSPAIMNPHTHFD
ncbi:MAG: hypothetical protein K5920_01480 [Bacteroidales bacterium]|nr:hypothetical protein [Bacteroidales bacterium]